MNIITVDKDKAEQERLEKKLLLLEQERAEDDRKAWKNSCHYDYVIKILEEEMGKANNISALPLDLTMEERGHYSLAMQLACERLKKIKDRLMA